MSQTEQNEGLADDGHLPPLAPMAMPVQRLERGAPLWVLWARRMRPRWWGWLPAPMKALRA